MPDDTPLRDVTFCAVDVETTGTSPARDEIVELGAVRSRAGARTGTFDTLVLPSKASLPPDVQRLTGITTSMLERAEPLQTVLPSFLEFSHGATFVAHNARFDHAFLSRACRCLDYEPPPFEVVDTHLLARRLARDDVPDLRLQTLAACLRVANEPRHRAFPDAAACLDLLHALIEMASAYGVETIGDLLELQRAPLTRHLGKARLCRDLPRSPGVYVLADARGAPLLVERADDLRRAVRSWFTTDDHVRAGDVRIAAASVRGYACRTDLETVAMQARLTDRLAPRLRPARGTVPAYLSLPFRRGALSVTTRPRAGRVTHVGPFPGTAVARRVADMLRAVHGPEPVDAAAVREDLARGLPLTVSRVEATAGVCAEQHRAALRELRQCLDRTLALLSLADAGCVDVAGGRLVDGFADLPGHAPPDPPDLGPFAVAPQGLDERIAVARCLSSAREPKS